MSCGNTFEKKLKLAAVKCVRDKIIQDGLKWRGEDIYIKQQLSSDDQTTTDMMKNYKVAIYFIIVYIGEFSPFSNLQRMYSVTVNKDFSTELSFIREIE